MEYKRCLVELDEVIHHMSPENIRKIPQNILNNIKEKKDKQYTWKWEDNKQLAEQKLNRKTIAILSYLNMEYLLNEEQKEYMKKIHKLAEQRLEKEKKEKYNSKEIFKNRKNSI